MVTKKERAQGKGGVGENVGLRNSESVFPPHLSVHLL